MLQRYDCSSFPSYPKNPPQLKGFVRPLQGPLKETLIATNHCQYKKPFRYRYQRLLIAADGLGKSEIKITRKCKLFRRYLLWHPLDCGLVLKLKDNYLTVFENGFCKQLNALYRFSRPHTVIGTVVGITSVSLLPLESIADLTPAFFVGLLKALIPSIFMNIYVVGLNQLFDVEIDKVNKPNLPLASGEFSMEFGLKIVMTFLLMSFAMGILFKSPPLLSALLLSFVVGSAYSIELPLLRWKRNAFLAAACILFVRAVVVQFAFFFHIQRYILDRPVVLTRSLVFAVVCMCIFSTVIALFKDIPDVDGDRDFGIQSFSVRLGQERVFWLSISMLFVAYAVAIVIGVSSSFLVCKLITVLGHCSLALLLWLRARSVNLSNQASITSCYMFIWKLLYLEYLLIPFAR